MKVWKYDLPWGDIVTLALPIGARVLSVEPQGASAALKLWALVDPNADPELRRFRLAGTGHEITDNVSHISTFQLQDGQIVFHVFEILP